MSSPLPPFRRVFFGAAERLTRIGEGELGGKAEGLRFMHEELARRLPGGRLAEFLVEVPTLTVLPTGVFDRFMAQNRLEAVVRDEPADDRLALAFQRADLPADLLGDLRALVEQVRTPLAIRSSSRLEDALRHPFAGVYVTKMLPNNQPDADTRFRRVAEAIKLVYASTFFRRARLYRERTGHADAAERMAVIIQEVVGRRHVDRFYPDVSGVARSYNFYRYGRARPEDGVAVLALGLGKTIVDGGLAWAYSPRHPRAMPPVASARDLLRWTQTQFWAVNMGRPPAYDPLAETEYLVAGTLEDAAFDDTLRLVASTYDPASDRLVPGTGRDGPRAVTFAPLLDLEIFHLNEAVRGLLALAEAALGGPVEIEFAATLDERAPVPARLGFLQVRPLAVPGETAGLPGTEAAGERVLLASDQTLGHGRETGVRDIVYVKPEAFEARHTPAIAREVEAFNRSLVQAGRPYVLIGFGRWGSADPWLGIPVAWNDVCGARALVEVQTARLPVEPSQGAHFFHNLASFEVVYFAVSPAGTVDWGWLAAQPVAAEGRFVRHVTLDRPLTIAVDGRTGRGVMLKP
jgi:hypothetical protein